MPPAETIQVWAPGLVSWAGNTASSIPRPSSEVNAHASSITQRSTLVPCRADSIGGKHVAELEAATYSKDSPPARRLVFRFLVSPQFRRIGSHSRRNVRPASPPDWAVYHDWDRGRPSTRCANWARQIADFPARRGTCKTTTLWTISFVSGSNSPATRLTADCHSCMGRPNTSAPTASTAGPHDGTDPSGGVARRGGTRSRGQKSIERVVNGSSHGP